MSDAAAQPHASYVDDYAANSGAVPGPAATPPAAAPTAAPTVDTPTAAAAAATPSEALEDQNIFELLGIHQASEEEKEVFLDELQQVIWEDFVEKDVELLLTEDELKEFQGIANNNTLAEEDKQNQMIEYLEKIIPDLEKIMLEKAIELKEELTRERIDEYRQFYKDDQAKQDMIQSVQALADQGQWKSVAVKLNSLHG